jgi:hypothetical protein
MRCPTCNMPLPDTAMLCNNCRTDTSFKAISPQGQRYGPYDCQSFRQYVQEGRIAEDWRVILGDADPLPLAQVMERVQFLTA